MWCSFASILQANRFRVLGRPAVWCSFASIQANFVFLINLALRRTRPSFRLKDYEIQDSLPAVGLDVISNRHTETLDRHLIEIVEATLHTSGQLTPHGRLSSTAHSNENDVGGRRPGVTPLLGVGICRLQNKTKQKKQNRRKIRQKQVRPRAMGVSPVHNQIWSRYPRRSNHAKKTSAAFIPGAWRRGTTAGGPSTRGKSSQRTPSR